VSAHWLLSFLYLSTSNLTKLFLYIFEAVTLPILWWSRGRRSSSQASFILFISPLLHACLDVIGHGLRGELLVANEAHEGLVPLPPLALCLLEHGAKGQSKVINFNF